MELDVLKYQSFGKIIELVDIRISLLLDIVVRTEEKQKKIKIIEISKITNEELKKLLNIKPPKNNSKFIIQKSSFFLGEFEDMETWHLKMK